MNKLSLIILIIILCVGIVSSKVSTTTMLQMGSTQQVVIEEYVPKVIIEGKWGTAPGEFGVISPMEAEYMGIPHDAPQGLAVDSKGKIYILDHINNRIQKFSNSGKYVLSIPVEGCVDEKGNSVVKHIIGAKFEVVTRPKVIGVNIVIDSQDNLYCYCIKGDKGEVWQFKDDKLVRKWETSFRGYIYIDDEDNVLIGRSGIKEKFNVTKGKIEKDEEIEKRRRYKISIDKLDKDKAEVSITLSDKKRNKTIIGPPRKLIGKERLFIDVSDVKVNQKKKEIYVMYGIGFGESFELYTNVYDLLTGELLTTLDKGPGSIKMDGNGYVITSDDRGVKVLRYELGFKK